MHGRRVIISIIRPGLWPHYSTVPRVDIRNMVHAKQLSTGYARRYEARGHSIIVLDKLEHIENIVLLLFIL